MEIRFEDEYGDIVKKSNDNIFIPNIGDLLSIEKELFRVGYRFVNYDKNIIVIDIKRE